MWPFRQPAKPTNIELEMAKRELAETRAARARRLDLAQRIAKANHENHYAQRFSDALTSS